MFENLKDLPEALLKPLECAVCFEILCDPKELACHHCFCKSCLDDCLQFNGNGTANLQCPNKCKGIINIKANETTNSLGVNYSLKGFLDQLTGANKITPPPCNGKEGCDSSVIFSCTTCSKKLCKNCKEEDLCEDNYFVPVRLNEKSAELEAFCETHNSYVKHVCMECGDKLICTYCYHRVHKNHKSRTLENHYMEMRGWFLSQIKDVEKCFSTANVSYAIELEKFDDYEKALKEEIKQRKVKLLSSFLKSLEKEEEKIFDILKRKKEEYRSGFNVDCSSSGNPLERLQCFAKELESKKNYEILSEHSQIGRKFQSLSLIHCVEGELKNNSPNSSLGSLTMEVFTTSCPETAVDLKIQKNVYTNDANHLVDVKYLKEYIQGIESKQLFKSVCSVSLENHEPELILNTQHVHDQRFEVTRDLAPKRLQYEREFLLKFQYMKICLIKPTCLPDDTDIVLNNSHTPTKPLEQAVCMDVSQCPVVVSPAQPIQTMDINTFINAVEPILRNFKAKNWFQCISRISDLNIDIKEKFLFVIDWIYRNAVSQQYTLDAFVNMYHFLKNNAGPELLVHMDLMGKLFVSKVVQDPLMFFCIENILNNLLNGELYSQALLNLFVIIGKELDQPQRKKKIDLYFSRLDVMLKRYALTKKTRANIQNVFALRRNGWTSNPSQQTRQQVDLMKAYSTENLQQTGAKPKNRVRTDVVTINHQHFNPLLQHYQPSAGTDTTINQPSAGAETCRFCFGRMSLPAWKCCEHCGNYQ